MAKSEAAMLHEFEGVRTGKANPALVENIMVDAYGSSMRLRDMAGITAPETRMILIQPWDAGTVESISKAIQAANLGLNPAIDGMPSIAGLRPRLAAWMALLMDSTVPASHGWIRIMRVSGAVIPAMSRRRMDEP